MHRLMAAYLFQNSTVVIDKSMIVNAKDDEFTEVSLILSKEQIEQYHDELVMMGELAQDEDGEWR